MSKTYLQPDLPFATRFTPPPDVRLECKDASLTTQADAELADINNLMARYALGEDIPVKDGQPFFGDFSALPDMQTALDMMQRAEADFADLPVDLRARFDNDPRALVDFVLDASNRAEAEELGLVSPSASNEPDPPASMALEASQAEGGRGGATSSPPSEASPNT